MATIIPDICLVHSVHGVHCSLLVDIFPVAAYIYGSVSILKIGQRMDRRRPELFEDFFGVKELPPASVPQVFLENVTDPRSIALVFKTYLKDASSPEDEAAVIDFATHILSMLNFLEDGKRIMTRREPRFIMCSTEVVGRPDIAIQAGYADYSLLVQTAKVSLIVDLDSNTSTNVTSALCF